MRHSFFKYFSRPEHAEAFLDGKLFFRSLRYFTGHEDGDVRGDVYEGTHVYRPEQGLELNMAQGGKHQLPGSEFRSSVVKAEILVFCMSMSYSVELAREFDSVACVEVNDKRALLRRVRLTLEARGQQVFTGPVQYRSASLPPKHRWALPELICMTKAPKFRRQDEYRIAFGEPSAFVPENVEVKIVPEGYRDIPRVDASAENAIIEIGSIRDVCSVRTG
jgi:uncharacterized protein with GYD domain